MTTAAATPTATAQGDNAGVPEDDSRPIQPSRRAGNRKGGSSRFGRSLLPVRVLRAICQRVQRSLELRKYDPYTIAAYFRKQGAHVGEGCFIIPTNLGTEPYLVRIGNRVAIAGDVSFITHDGAAWRFRDEYPDLQVFGPIVVEDDCVIGQGALLFPNVRVGHHSVVGAGSVVISDVPPNTVVMGVPARPFGSIERYREKCLERWRVQRPAGIMIDPGETWWNSKHYASNREKLRNHLMALYSEELSK
jgi:acetyltransferase-like isoleucine patch superfamily enzyme